MKMTPDNPVLTAFVLGELNEAESRAIAKSLDADRALAKEGAEIFNLAGLLEATLGADRFSLGGDRHEEIFKSGRRPDADVLVLDHRRRSRRQSFIAVAGVAAVVVAGFIGLSKLGVEAPGASGGGSDVAGNASPDDLRISAGDQAEPGDGVVTPSVNPSVSLPMNVGMAVPAMVEESLTRHKKLPEPGEFDVAAWVNLTQPTAGPKVVVGKVAAYTELGSCPWNPEHSLLMVNLRAVDEDKVPLKAELNLDPSRVKSAIMVGAGESANLVAEIGDQLEGSKTWLYELELIVGDEKLGSINLEFVGADGETQSGYLPLASRPLLNRAVSNDFETARTLAAFALWGSKEDRNSERLVEIAHSARDLLMEVKDGNVRYALDAVLMAEEYLISQ
jgi:hypothetical protein